MPAERTVRPAAAVLSVGLAVVFLASGIPKLVGGHTLFLSAAAMTGWPVWIRVVVGLVEVASAIALVIPRASPYGAVALAILMVPASATQYMSGEGGAWVPILLLVLLLVLVWWRVPDAAGRLRSALAHEPHGIVDEGVVAGVIGATCVAVWFLIVDLIAGHALFTPETLGRSLFRVLGPLPVGESTALYVIAYTIVHYVAFIAIGLVAAALVRLAGVEPSVLVGVAILFVAFEIGFYALVAILQQATALGGLAWYQVLVGNLIAAAAMGRYLWTAHPLLRDQLAHAFDVRS